MSSIVFDDRIVEFGDVHPAWSRQRPADDRGVISALSFTIMTCPAFAIALMKCANMLEISSG